jgi:divalent metal cation (Fe/Co/Zn/Cd) transporter
MSHRAALISISHIAGARSIQRRLRLPDGDRVLAEPVQSRRGTYVSVNDAGTFRHISMMRVDSVGQSREQLVRQGLRLNYTTIAYNALEGVVSIVAGVIAGSVALVGFGFDSVIELTASGAAQWRLRADGGDAARERAERGTVRVVGGCFLALAAYIGYESLRSLWFRERPAPSAVGIVIAALSLIVMPLLARAKRRIAVALGSRTLTGEATQTSLCAYLSAIVLGGLALNALLGWWWADPIAGMAMIPIIVKEGVEALRDESECARCG